MVITEHMELISIIICAKSRKNLWYVFLIHHPIEGIEIFGHHNKT